MANSTSCNCICPSLNELVQLNVQTYIEMFNILAQKAFYETQQFVQRYKNDLRMYNAILVQSISYEMQTIFVLSCIIFYLFVKILNLYQKLNKIQNADVLSKLCKEERKEEDSDYITEDSDSDEEDRIEEERIRKRLYKKKTKIIKISS